MVFLKADLLQSSRLNIYYETIMTYALAGAIGFVSGVCSSAIIAKIVYSETGNSDNTCQLCTITSVGALATVILGTIIPLIFAEIPFTMGLLITTCFAAQAGALAGLGIALLVVYVASRCFPENQDADVENLFFRAQRSPMA